MAYVFFFSGCAISWKTKLHSFVTTSTNHSELVASAMAAREAKFIWSLLSSLNFNVKADLFAHLSLDLFSDSIGMVAISANNVLSSATKHVDIADFYVRELVQSGVVTVSYVKTVYMVADVLTKALGPDKFFQFIGVIMGLLRSGARTADVRTLSSTEEGRKTTPMSSMPQRGVRTATPMSRLPQRGVESAPAPMASLPSGEVTPKLPSNRKSRKHARAANPRLGLMQTRLKR